MLYLNSLDIKILPPKKYNNSKKEMKFFSIWSEQNVQL